MDGRLAQTNPGMAQAWSTRLRALLPDDPGLSGLRRAVRAALVIPATFAFAKFVINDVQVTTFVVFGCFALLVIADFGGMRLPRAIAYASTTLVGGGLVILGTLASTAAWVGALAMLLIGFAIQFAGVFGGYVPAAQTALQLSFVLAVSVPTPTSALGARLGGWFLAGIVSTLSGVFFWPRFEQVSLLRTAAAACRSLAGLIRAQREAPQHADLSRHQEAARAAVDRLRRQYAATPTRPIGPTRRARAFVELLSELERTLEFVTRPFQLLPGARPWIEEGNQLAASVVRTLEASATVLTGGEPPNLIELQQARRVHRQALDRWAGDALRSGRSPEEVLAGLGADHALKVTSYRALAIGSDAVIAAGHELAEELPLPTGTPREGARVVPVRILRTVRTYLVPTSSALHNSVRAGFGLALAVLVARVLALSHAFWVVLGTLSVLRSNALGTGRTTMEALAGTAAGFAVGAIFTVLVGTTSAALWAALPVAVFLAAYAPSALGFVTSQAAFTINLIILFNLISPVGWQIGIARIEDVAVGVAISVVTGILLWPRGARRELALALAGTYRSVADYLAASFDRTLEGGPAEDARQARTIAVRDRDRAREAFDQFLVERGAKRLDPATAGFLVASGTYAMIAGDSMNEIAGMGYEAAGCPDGVLVLRNQTNPVVEDFVRLADRLSNNRSAAVTLERVADDLLRDASLACMRLWRDDPARGRSAVAVIWAAEWLGQLGELAVELERPIGAAVEAAQVPWWR
jgi:uncharacterized membrane protein YccC